MAKKFRSNFSTTTMTITTTTPAVPCRPVYWSLGSGIETIAPDGLSKYSKVRPIVSLSHRHLYSRQVDYRRIDYRRVNIASLRPRRWRRRRRRPRRQWHIRLWNRKLFPVIFSGPSNFVGKKFQINFNFEAANFVFLAPPGFFC